MDVTIPEPRPVLEGNAELDRAARDSEEFALVEIDDLVKNAHRRESRHADANRAYLLRFDQRDVHERSELLRKSRSQTPAGGTASCDHHLLHRLFCHWKPLRNPAAPPDSRSSESPCASAC